MFDAKQVLSYFGGAVQYERTSRGLSQAALAERAKINRSYLAGVESGRRNPTLTMVWRIAKALGVPAGRLLGRLDHMEATLDEFDRSGGAIENP